jgi:glutamate synthase (NADPH/NADH) small chain
MNEMDARERARKFSEVNLGYFDSQAVEESVRCLNCKNPGCVAGCPVNVPIPEFIQHIKHGEYAKAYEAITSTNSLPGVCGRVCPQEEQCEKGCVLLRTGKPIAIGNLERFASDFALKAGLRDLHKEPPNGRKVAVVGSGPAGLTCAGDLARLGYDVTVFEALHTPGGVLVYGIPEFRLPKSIVAAEIESLKQLGVKVETNVSVGYGAPIDALMREEGFSAVFIGSGAGLPQFMKIPGENLIGVYSANEFLTRINLMKAYQPGASTPVKKGKKVAVVGGGNVAMDAARCALRLGADGVHIVYRRSQAEMPARVEEVKHAEEEGIIFDMLSNPVEILGKDGCVTGMRCVRMALGEPDASGRRSVKPIPESSFEMECDVAVIAIGTRPNPALTNSEPRIKTEKWGGIVVEEETGATSLPGVYAGGDAVTGSATVILAMGAGKKAAASIHKLLSEQSPLSTNVDIPP